MRDLVTLPVEPDVVARALDRHADFRVLRRLQPMRRSAARRPDEAVGIALDVETTGLDHRHHEVIELAVQRFRMDQFGRIVEAGRPRSWLQQPSEPIPAEITAVTGITDDQVARRSIHDGEATCMILDSDFVVTHNAAFDRPFVEKRLPLAAGRPWVCTLTDVDWKAAGFRDRTLSGLLEKMGWFYEAHRAEVDVNALLHLIDHPLESGGTVGREALRMAKEPSWIVDAVDAPFSAKEVLKQRGYRWDAERRVWSARIADSAIADERSWASLMLYGGRREPDARMTTWIDRHAVPAR